MPPLSVVIITRNEERNIGRCLGSVKNIADDIVVVDSGSTDRTLEICKQQGARVFEHTWEGYSATKNFANSLAGFDFIFSIDADESLSAGLEKSILELKKKDGITTCRINRLTNYCGQWIRHGGWYPDLKLRFFDRRQAQWEGQIHERLTVPDELNTPVLEGDCFHYSYYSIEGHKAQARRYSELTARDLYEKGKHAGLPLLLFAPLIKFIRLYLLYRGFLDGMAGFTIARISAHAVYIKYAALRRLWRTHESDC